MSQISFLRLFIVCGFIGSSVPEYCHKDGTAIWTEERHSMLVQPFPETPRHVVPTAGERGCRLAAPTALCMRCTRSMPDGAGAAFESPPTEDRRPETPARG